MSQQPKLTSSGAHLPAVAVDQSVDGLGKFLAVGCIDGFVRLYNALDEMNPVEGIVAGGRGNGKAPENVELGFHRGQIHRVAWAPMKTPNTLLVATTAELVIWVGDGKVNGHWVKKHTIPVQSEWGAPLSIAWADFPYEKPYGMFAVSHMDGCVRIHSCLNKDFGVAEGWVLSSTFLAVPSRQPCTGVSWAPCYGPGYLLSLPASAILTPQEQSQHRLPAPRLVTCGVERSVRVWKLVRQNWVEEDVLNDFPQCTTVVRDVMWAPNDGLPFTYIAACTDEGAVCIWLRFSLDDDSNNTNQNNNNNNNNNNGQQQHIQNGASGTVSNGHANIAEDNSTKDTWRPVGLPVFPQPACRVSWSSQGTVLAVTCADGSSSMWMESEEGPWVRVVNDVAAVSQRQ